MMSLLQQIQNAAFEVETDLAIPPVSDKEELIGRIAESVTAKDSRTLQAYILEQRLPDPDQFWELTTLLAPCLITENLEEVPHFFTTVRRCLVYFSRHGKPKEMVLALLEQVEGTKDDALFITLLPCLQHALLQLPVKRGRSLELALDTLGSYIGAIPAPQNWNLEGEEMKLLETDKTVQRFLNVVPALLEFIHPFLVGKGDGDGKGRQWERRVMKKHLLRLSEHPLSFLDLRFDAKGCSSPKTHSREMAETVVESLSQLETNFYRLLVQNPAEGITTYTDQKGKKRKGSSGYAEVEDEDMEAENAENELIAAGGSAGTLEDCNTRLEDEFSQLSGACLAYLIQVEWLGLKCWPIVYGLTHLFHANLPYVTILITNPAHTAVYKGLALLSFYLDLMDDETLNLDTLDDDNVMPVVNAIITVMRFCPIQELRFKGLAVFKSFFSKMDHEGRQQLMRSVLASCDHAGVKAVVVSLLKAEIDTALQKVEAEAKSCGDNVSLQPVVNGTSSDEIKKTSQAEGGDYDVWWQNFFHHKLEQLLHLATRLPEGATSDLLEESDLVMATLNLLRYLVLRDSMDHTGVWSMLSWMEKEYLSAIRTGLDMSVAHYQLELDNVISNHSRLGGRGESTTLSSITVAGSQLPAMGHEQQLNMLNAALTTFDMMKCVLARVSELIDQRKPKV